MNESLLVVKVGGSLLDWPGLPAALTAYLDARRSATEVVVVAGGGPAADLVRNLDRIHGLGEERSHELALRALDLTAHLLAALVPRLRLVTLAQYLSSDGGESQVPLINSRYFIRDADGMLSASLPHSWAVTSDSIAARLADCLGGAALVLLKSAPVPPGCDRAEAARLGLVDAYFPKASKGLDQVWYRNLRASAEVDQEVRLT